MLFAAECKRSENRSELEMEMDYTARTDYGRLHTVFHSACKFCTSGLLVGTFYGICFDLEDLWDLN